jgi:hypothetical protein
LVLVYETKSKRSDLVLIDPRGSDGKP